MADPISQEIALLRLVAQGVVGREPRSSEEVVRHLLCLQAQDYWSGLASIAVRCPGPIDGLFDSGAVVRAWPLRGTLHIVAASDLAWLRSLLAGRQLAGAAKMQARMGIDDRMVRHAGELTVGHITAHGPCPRSQLAEVWRAEGIDTADQRGYQLLWHLSHLGVVHFGPVAGKHQLVVLSDPPTGAVPDRETALTDLARRFYVGHGPATPEDLQRWADLTVADLRTATENARPHLASLTLDGQEYLLAPDTQDRLARCRRDALSVIALPGFDEMIFGYRDRRPTVPADVDPLLFPHRNGAPRSTVLRRGRVVATWTKPGRRTDPVEVVPVVQLPARTQADAVGRVSALLKRI